MVEPRIVAPVVVGSIPIIHPIAPLLYFSVPSLFRYPSFFVAVCLSLPLVGTLGGFAGSRVGADRALSVGGLAVGDLIAEDLILEDITGMASRGRVTMPRVMKCPDETPCKTTL